MRESNRFCKGTSTHAKKHGAKAEGQLDEENSQESRLDAKRTVLETQFKQELLETSVEDLRAMAADLDMKFVAGWKQFDLYYAVVYAKADKAIEKEQAKGTRFSKLANRSSHRAFRQVRRGIERMALQFRREITFRLHGQSSDGFANVTK
jgi:hypothetical protein